MRNFIITGIVFLAVSVAFLFSGCGAMQYRTPERERRRRHVLETDFYHMADDIDWVIGIDRPSRLFDQTLR